MTAKQTAAGKAKPEECLVWGPSPSGLFLPSRKCVAIAHEGRHTLAMLKRQTGRMLWVSFTVASIKQTDTPPCRRPW
jgi:hypothetical protein